MCEPFRSEPEVMDSGGRPISESCKQYPNDGGINKPIVQALLLSRALARCGSQCGSRETRTRTDPARIGRYPVLEAYMDAQLMAM